MLEVNTVGKQKYRGFIVEALRWFDDERPTQVEQFQARITGGWLNGRPRHTVKHAVFEVSVTEAKRIIDALIAGRSRVKRIGLVRGFQITVDEKHIGQKWKGRNLNAFVTRVVCKSLPPGKARISFTVFGDGAMAIEDAKRRIERDFEPDMYKTRRKFKLRKVEEAGPKVPALDSWENGKGPIITITTMPTWQVVTKAISSSKIAERKSVGTLHWDGKLYTVSGGGLGSTCDGWELVPVDKYRQLGGEPKEYGTKDGTFSYEGMIVRVRKVEYCMTKPVRFVMSTALHDQWLETERAKHGVKKAA